MQQPLPIEVIEKIFMHLHGRFGNEFLDKFRIGEVNDDGFDIGILNAKQTWANDLKHLSPERIRKGLETKFQFAPSCDVFERACVPVPACHRDPKILALPKPKANEEVAKKNLAKIHAMLNIKKMPA